MFFFRRSKYLFNLQHLTRTICINC